MLQLSTIQSIPYFFKRPNTNEKSSLKWHLKSTNRRFKTSGCARYTK